MCVCGAMSSRQSLSLLVVLAAVLLTGSGQDDPYYYEDEGFAFGEQVAIALNYYTSTLSAMNESSSDADSSCK